MPDSTSNTTLPNASTITSNPSHTSIYGYLYSQPHDPFDLPTYLERINASQLIDRSPTKELLSDVHWAHLSNTVFENLDTTLWKKEVRQSDDGSEIVQMPVGLRPGDIWNKLVVKRRGGWW